jgi:hypothetical protein
LGAPTGIGFAVAVAYFAKARPLLIAAGSASSDLSQRSSLPARTLAPPPTS